MKNLDLKKIKKKQKEISSDWVRVGMSTCGIAAGADRVYEYLEKKIEKNDLAVKLRKCGCLGACYAEPLVEVKLQGLPRVVYGNVDEKMAERIIKEHIMTGRVLDSGVYELKTSEI